MNKYEKLHTLIYKKAFDFRFYNLPNGQEILVVNKAAPDFVWHDDKLNDVLESLAGKEYMFQQDDCHIEICRYEELFGEDTLIYHVCRISNTILLPKHPSGRLLACYREGENIDILSDGTAIENYENWQEKCKVSHRKRYEKTPTAYKVIE